MGTSIHRVLLFPWAMLIRKLIAKELMGTYIDRVLVIDGCLYSLVYGRYTCIKRDSLLHKGKTGNELLIWFHDCNS